MKRIGSNGSAKPSVSILTPTITGREKLLSEAAASVRAQTFPAWKYEHLVLLDTERLGCSKTVNALAREASGEWLLILADDDLLLPGCLETHLAVSEDADIVYAPPLVWGEDPGQFTTIDPPNIPSLSLIRREVWEAVGGYDEKLGCTEDMKFYEMAMLREARFVRTTVAPTWVYRFWGGNKSRTS